MKRYVKAKSKSKSATNSVKLRVKFEPYQRYSSAPIKKATVSGPTLLDALKKMADRMLLYIDSDLIEEENYTADEVISRIASENGDGCDFILLLKNLTTGEIYIEEDIDDDYSEDWDD